MVKNISKIRLIVIKPKDIQILCFFPRILESLPPLPRLYTRFALRALKFSFCDEGEGEVAVNCEKKHNFSWKPCSFCGCPWMIFRADQVQSAASIYLAANLVNQVIHPSITMYFKEVCSCIGFNRFWHTLTVFRKQNFMANFQKNQKKFHIQ